MKFIFTLLSACLLCTSTTLAQRYLEMIDAGTFPVDAIVQEAEAYFDGKDTGRGTGYKQFKRWEYMANRLKDESGYVPTITENLEELRRYNAYLNETASNRESLNDNWQELGPQDWNATTSWNPGVGRITSIAIDQTDADHIIVGANTGGVWRTTDGGQNWLPLGDTFTNLTVYSVAIDPSNSDTYYFGSSSGLVFKSTDAGGTWTQLADMSESRIIKIVINPDTPSIMFACSENAGLYRSTDSGATWTNTGIDSRSFDVEFKPGDTNVVYASGTSFQFSTDGGTNFTSVGGFTGEPKMIGVSANDPSRVYVVEAAGGSFGGLYTSNDSGTTFIELVHTGRNYFGYDTNGFDPGGQAPRDMDVAVNPANADEVHIAGILTWRSLDGGVTFTCTSDWIPGAAAGANIGYCHADVDLLLFEGTTLFAGTDGGIFKAENTTNLDANYYEDLTAGIGIRQFYKIGISQTANVIVTGGSQDNGTSFYTAADGWRDWLGADGMEGFIDKNNNSIMYGTTQGGQLYRTDNGASSYTGLSEPGPGGGNWVTPFEQDPTTPNTIYVGYDKVYKSTNKGNSWTAASQSFGANLTDVKIAPSNNQIMYAARTTSLFRTEDGGATNWSSTTAPGGGINNIAIHPQNPNKIAVTTTSSSKVLVSNDGGQTWENYRFNLPNFSANAIVWDDNGGDGLYVGMNYGIYYIDAGLTEWQPYSNLLPNVIINELEVNTVTDKLYAASYGRGLWVSPLADPTVILGSNTNTFAQGITLHPNPATDKVTVETRLSVLGAIRVYDVTGKLVIFKNDLEFSRNTQLDISGLNTGVYYIRINSENGTATKKLLKN